MRIVAYQENKKGNDNSFISFHPYQVLDEADSLLNDEFEKSIDEI